MRKHQTDKNSCRAGGYLVSDIDNVVICCNYDPVVEAELIAQSAARQSEIIATVDAFLRMTAEIRALPGLTNVRPSSSSQMGASPTRSSRPWHLTDQRQGLRGSHSSERRSSTG